MTRVINADQQVRAVLRGFGVRLDLWHSWDDLVAKLIDAVRSGDIADAERPHCSCGIGDGSQYAHNPACALRR